MRSNSSVPSYQTRAFWIAVGFTLFCSGNFFLFLFASYSVKDETFKIEYTIIYSTFTILKNLFICIGLELKSDPSLDINISSHKDREEIWEIPSEFKKN